MLKTRKIVDGKYDWADVPSSKDRRGSHNTKKDFRTYILGQNIERLKDAIIGTEKMLRDLRSELAATEEDLRNVP